MLIDDNALPEQLSYGLKIAGCNKGLSYFSVQTIGDLDLLSFSLLPTFLVDTGGTCSKSKRRGLSTEVSCCFCCSPFCLLSAGSNCCSLIVSQLAFYVNLHRAVMRMHCYQFVVGPLQVQNCVNWADQNKNCCQYVRKQLPYWTSLLLSNMGIHPALLFRQPQI